MKSKVINRVRERNALERKNREEANAREYWLFANESMDAYHRAEAKRWYQFWR